MKKPKDLSQILIILSLSLLILGGCSPQPSPAVLDDIGSNILARAKIWVDAKVPYGSFDNDPNNDYYDGYRADCSGFVSYAWGIPRPGTDTTSFLPGGYVINISISDLQPGDALNNQRPGSDGHIVLFVKWLDKVNHTFEAYDLNTSPGFAADKTFTLIQMGNTSDWTIKELDQYAQGPYQAQRLLSTTPAIVLGAGAAPSPMSSTIVPGNVQSNDCSSLGSLDRANADEVIRWMISATENRQIDRILCLTDDIQVFYTYEYPKDMKTGTDGFGVGVIVSKFVQDLQDRLYSSPINCKGYFMTDEVIDIWTSGWSPLWKFPQSVAPDQPDAEITPDSDNITFRLIARDGGIWYLQDILFSTWKFEYFDWFRCH